MDIFRSLSAEIVQVVKESQTPLDTIKSMKLDRRFSDFDPEDLAITSLDVVLSF
jgi:hypothetical protein